jgi:hypothetical protein
VLFKRVPFIELASRGRSPCCKRGAVLQWAHEITHDPLVAAGIPLPFGHKEKPIANAIPNDHQTTKQQIQTFPSSLITSSKTH